MEHIKYDKKGNIIWISSGMEFEYRRGNISRELWESIKKFLNTK